MKPRAKKNLFFYLVILIIIFFGYFLIIKTFEENIIFFVSPKDIILNKHSGKIIRLGGLVKEGSIISIGDGKYQFIITDMDKEIKVYYQGILPSLFRDKQGVIAKGRLDGNGFIADEILAKHDEKYIPKEIQDSLKKSNLWQEK